MGRKRNRFLYAFILLVSTVVLLAACGGGSSKSSSGREDKKIIKIGYQKGNTIHILKETGYLEEALEEKGYSVEWKMFTHGGMLLEGLYSKAIDFGHAADGPGVFAQASGKPLVYVGADAPHSEGVGIMTLKDSGITSVEELKGKKLGALKGGNHHYLSILALEQAGLTIDDVQWVYPEDAAQGRAILETGEVDALASYDPFFASAEIELDTVTLTEGKDYNYPNHTYYFATPEFQEDHPELVELILETIDKSDQWANENKPEVAELLSKALDINIEVTTRQVERRTFGASPITEEMIDSQQRLADKYYEVGLIPKEIDVSEVMPIK
ncbi:MAG: aliphatic sulfonate ABC transporter substrate-binding protein [Bacillus sp. (in: firmicutes)]